MGELLILWGILLVGISGVPGLFLNRQCSQGQGAANVCVLLGAGLGLAGVVHFYSQGESPALVLPWSIPGAAFVIALDALSAFFLVPVFLISALGSIYGLSYWKQSDHPKNGRKLRLFYGVLAAAMALVVVAGNGILFLAAWEVMALAGYFLVTTDDQEEEARQAGWIYLVATHFGTLGLFALFALLRVAAGSFCLTPVGANVDPVLAGAILILAVFGFGLKAGIMPLHVWLPGAHAAAPSHVSALLSGVLIKMGIYGIVRVTALLPPFPVEWGGILLGLGVLSGVLGVAFAVGQHDLKRLLAYHSIENIGIIVMGIGLAMIGRSRGQAVWVFLGLSGGLLHVWNHSLFKALLFFSAGSVVHAVKTRDIDHLGGLAKLMPRTALCFLIGAVAICGLPPLNGFVSELLIYIGLFRTVENPEASSFVLAAFAAPALALIGALAVACFVKVSGAVFLGAARSEHARHAHESGPLMIGPMAVLAGLCFLIGLAPLLAAPMLDQAVRAWAPEWKYASTSIYSTAPLGWVSGMAFLLAALLIAAALVLWTLLRRHPLERGATWSCGYVAPTPRMQYTSSSFAQILVSLFSWALRPKVQQPRVTGLFPQKTVFHSDVSDTVLEEAVMPSFRFLGWLCSWFRIFQQGSLQMYVLYLFAVLLVLLLWS